MIRIRIDPGDRLQRSLSELARSQVPYAMRLASNDTAYQVRQAWKREIPRVFRRPVPLTRNAVLYSKADRSRSFAEVFIRDEAFKGTPPARYLAPQVFGGSRRHKRMEAAMRYRGLLRHDQYVVPARGTLSTTGKLRGPMVTRLLAQVHASHDSYSNQSTASRTRRHRREERQTGYTTDHFALTNQHGKLPPGIYKRTNLGRLGSSVQPVLLFVRAPTYRERYDIFGLAERLFLERFTPNFDRAMDRALRTARR